MPVSHANAPVAQQQLNTLLAELFALTSRQLEWSPVELESAGLTPDLLAELQSVRDAMARMLTA